MEQSYIKVDKLILVDDYTVQYVINYSKDLSKCFVNGKNMFVKYEQNISNVPQSILLIPLLYNIAPITWFMDATLITEEIDKEFIESFNEIKNGFQSMYKTLKIGGNVQVNKIIDNTQELTKTKISATLFSGGIDSWSTYINNIEECPSMITVQGADISLDDEFGWNLVKTKINEIGNEYKSNCIFIKSNFKEFLNHDYLNSLFKKHMYNWWVNVQHGLGLVGLVAPISYINGITDIYVPSSYTKEFNKPWGSDPKIDNNIKWSNLKVYHDGYELSRQDKVKNIIQYTKEYNKNQLDIRVCWEGSGGVNCCRCEKCCRTILGIIVAGGNPKQYGFEVNNWIYEYIYSCFKRRQWIFSDDEIFMWNNIKNHINSDIYNSYNKLFFEWIINYDMTKYAQKSKTLYSKINRRLFK